MVNDLAGEELRTRLTSSAVTGDNILYFLFRSELARAKARILPLFQREG